MAGKKGEEHWNAKWRREKNYRNGSGEECCENCKSRLKSGRCSANHNARVSSASVCDELKK